MQTHLAWLAAVRPKTLTIAIVPVLTGTTLAFTETGNIAWPPAVLALLTALLIQIGTNLHNDAADFEKGTDSTDRLGPLRATAEGWLSAAQVYRAARGCFVGALLCGIFLRQTLP